MTTRKSAYPYWFVLPAAVVFTVLFLAPTIASFWFSLTRWDLFTTQFIGLENYRQFFREPFLIQGLVNTVIYAVLTSGTKTVLGLLLAVLLTSGLWGQGLLRTVIFFPVLVSTIGVGGRHASGSTLTISARAGQLSCPPSEDICSAM